MCRHEIILMILYVSYMGVLVLRNRILRETIVVAVWIANENL